MKISVLKAEDRGHADHGWLNARHSFSFGDHYDPAHMGFRTLRVINDDRVAPGAGFPTHPHRDMEIFSYVLEGSIAHKDSLGNARVIKPGEVQVMSAGSGVQHSEFNPSATEPLHLNQIWIRPRLRGIKPRYSEWKPQPGAETEAKLLMISGDGRSGSASIEQDADVYRILLKPGTSVSHQLASERGAWLQVVRGELSLNETKLHEGDGASTEDPGKLSIHSDTGAEALLFDLA